MAQQKQKQKQKGQGGQGAGQGQKKQPNPVTAPLDPAGLRKETRASTNLKFRPLERAIGAEVRASKQRTRQEGDWWQNYLKEVSGAQADTQAAYDQAAATTQGFISQAGATDAANTAALQSEAKANAAVRGAAPSTEAASREAAAGAQRNYLSAAYGGKNAAEGAIQHAYLADKRRIGAGQSIASRKEEMRRTRGFEKDRRDTRGERGNYAVEKRGELRDKERDYLIQRRAFPLEKKELTLKQQEAAADQRIAQQNADSSTRSSKASAKNAQTAAETAGKTGGKTPSEKNDAKAGRRNAWSEALALYRAEAPPKTPAEWAKFQSHLAEQSEISPAEAAWAVGRLKAKYSPGLEANPHGR